MGWPDRPAAVLAALALGAGGLGASVWAQSPPARVFGAVTVGGAPAPPGTRVEAVVNGKVCGEGVVRQVSDQIAVGFVVDVPHESLVAGCGVEGAEIQFRVGGRDADQTATFATGNFIRVDLDLAQQVSTPPPDAPTPPPFGANAPPPPPAPEATATPEPPPPTPPPATATPPPPEGTGTPPPEETATATPGPNATETATPPSDAATGTATAGVTATGTASTVAPTLTIPSSESEDEDDDGGSAVGMMVAAGVVALAAGGGVIYWLSRRT